MQEFIVEKDIPLCCEVVSSFPMGISTAFKKLEDTLTEVSKRTFYGVSHGTAGGGIIYRAAMEAANEQEATANGFEPFTVKQGKYIGKDLQNWRGNEQLIGQTFSDILANFDIDPTGACIEVYTGEDVRCMIRLKD